MASLDEMAAHLAAYDRDRTLVSARGRWPAVSQSRFTWSTTVNKVTPAGGIAGRPKPAAPLQIPDNGALTRLLAEGSTLQRTGKPIASSPRSGFGTLLRIRRRLFGGSLVNASPTPPPEQYSDEGFRQWLVTHDRPPYPARLALDLGPLAATARGLRTRRAGDLAPVTGTGHLILLSPGAVYMTWRLSNAPT